MSAQQIQLNCLVSYGPLDFNHSTLLNYIEPSSTTATLQAVAQVLIPVGVNNAVNLATLFSAFTAPVAIGWVDQTGQQLNWGMASGGTRFAQLPYGFSLQRLTTGTLPIIYFDNPGTVAVDLQIFGLSN